MRRIYFEDHGQDFLSWTVDDNGTVVDCEPFQLSIWGGARVLYPHLLRKGHLVDFVPKFGGPAKTLNYPVERVQILPQAEQPIHA
ncbi:hypothetical protein [Cupriavidus basilensis]|uniref:hypothetical protein n=1 Tax=Cupriavidus basilensis TaxID=68895 RepID=UPI0020A6BA46|nr:hypothetical protein [Cupriavidus basilensis]MCP3017423.1 hypothetical protein [Cupriavidus basilensis]